MKSSNAWAYTLAAILYCTAGGLSVAQDKKPDKPAKPAEADTSKLPQPQSEADVADVPAKDILIGGDEKQRYFLIGLSDKPAPKEGYRLLVVLPGGDGGIDFHAFIKRIHKNALPE